MELHRAIARVTGIGISLPWASRAGWVTKSELDVWTWRTWNDLPGVQSTAYAGFALCVPVAAEKACDLMDSLARVVRKGSRHPMRQGGRHTAEDLACPAAQRFPGAARAGGNAVVGVLWRRAARPGAVWPLLEQGTLPAQMRDETCRG